MTAPKKVVRSTEMMADSYRVLDLAIENGVKRLPRRTSKAGMTALSQMLDNPEVQSLIADTVLTEICEWFKFEGDE